MFSLAVEQIEEPARASVLKLKSENEVPAPASPEGGRLRRERKTVEFFAPAVAPKAEETLIRDGKGAKLRDIPNAAFKLSKVTGKDEALECLHRILYRRTGGAATRKKAILDFSGFVFEEGSKEKEMEARTAALSKMKLDIIHKIMDLLDISRGVGDKAAKMEKLLEFLQEPKVLNEVDLASREAAKKERVKAKREREGAKKERERVKKGKEKKRKATADKKKPAKKAKKEDSEEDEEEEGSGSEMEQMQELSPPPKSALKAAKPPTPANQTTEEDPAADLNFDVLKTDALEILKSFTSEQLSELTLKTIIRPLEEKYGYRLKSRKTDIKKIAQEFAESMPSPTKVGTA